MRGLVDRHHREAAQQEHETAEPDLRRDHERRPVAPRDQVGEGRRCRRPPARPSRSAPAWVNRTQPAAPVEPLDQRPDPVEGLLARAEGLAPNPGRGRVTRRRRARRRPGSRARRGRSSSRASRAGPAARSAARPDPISSTSECEPSSCSKTFASLSESRRYVPLVQVLQHPALAALVGLQPLERVARPHPRAHPELGAWLVPSGCPWPGRSGSRPGARRWCGPPRVARGARRASPSPSRSFAPSRSCDRAVDPRPVDQRAVARARVLEHRVGRCPRSARACATRSGRRARRRAGRAPDRHLLHDRHARPVAQHQLQRRDAPRRGIPQLPQKPPPRSSWRRQLGQSIATAPSVSGWKTGLSPLKPTRSDCLRVLRRLEGTERAHGLLAVRVGLQDHERLAVAAPRDLAGAHLRRLGARQQEVLGFLPGTAGTAAALVGDQREPLPVRRPRGVDHALRSALRCP